ncbi:MAG TPA: hypothetical protein VGE83_01030 [Terracidiphilus sp.]|jgi:hypothetical protein
MHVSNKAVCLAGAGLLALASSPALGQWCSPGRKPQLGDQLDQGTGAAVVVEIGQGDHLIL